MVAAVAAATGTTVAGAVVREKGWSRERERERGGGERYGAREQVVVVDRYC